LENAWLSEQQRAMLSRLEELHGQLESAELERLLDSERRRIARELHDRVEQTFFSIGLASRAALEADGSQESLRACLASVRDSAAQGMEQLRQAIFALTHAELQDPGLTSALARLVRDFRERAGMEVDLVLSGRERRVPTDVAEALHAVAREALTNVERHARASAAVLHLRVDRQAATLTVQDDGLGASALVLRTLADSAIHFGLRDARERVERIGGTLNAGPGEDGGFTVRAHVPLHLRDRP
jgi:signal transduction histidine kinase